MLTFGASCTALHGRIRQRTIDGPAGATILPYFLMTPGLVVDL